MPHILAREKSVKALETDYSKYYNSDTCEGNSKSHCQGLAPDIAYRTDIMVHVQLLGAKAIS